MPVVLAPWTGACSDADLVLAAPVIAAVASNLRVTGSSGILKVSAALLSDAVTPLILLIESGAASKGCTETLAAMVLSVG